MTWHPAHGVIALALAANYFAFQVELFDDEYEANHPRTSDANSITGSVFTWESFDKENAPKAFTVDPQIEIQLLSRIAPPGELPIPPVTTPETVRDKSPPSSPAQIAR